MEILDKFHALLREWPLTYLALCALALVLVAWLADSLAKRLLVRAVARLMRASSTRWDDAILDRGVVHRLAHVVPAVVIYLGVVLVPELPAALVTVARNVAMAWVVLTLALAISGLLGAADDIYQQSDRARERPIKGYLQVAKIIVFVLAGILIVAVLIERSPLLLLSGLGALGAVLMLVFKDTILSLVASMQLSGNDMLRVGDWITMPQLGVDGDVIDVALHTVKVQNFDKTITTIPTYRLISDSFRNWRGMSESGGRRIKRALHIDQGTIRYLDGEERREMRRFDLLDEYIAAKQSELEEFNQSLEGEGKHPVNTRRLTNLGTFRAYVVAWLRHHPKIRPDRTLLVRQLPPGPAGLPIEVYCFTNTTAWAEYEDIQSDIFDHLLAILPEFGLRVYQQPGGVDLERGLAAMAQARTAEAD